MKIKLFCLIALTGSLRLLAAPAADGAVPAAPVPSASGLQWDSESKSYAAKTGEATAPFTFFATNVSGAEISINSLQTSCGCTVAQLPTTPYKLAPGSNVAINVTMSLAGKTGAVTKTVNVDSSAGAKTLLVNVTIPTETKTETK